jgi:ABC-type nitrate/sulfonate/bicarbonate transport system ATPase subunit
MGHIQVDGVSKAYIERRQKPRTADSGEAAERGKKTAVLDDVDLEINDGELVCVIGPSGCGKSTLLRLIAGFEAPTTGAVLVNGKAVTGPSPEHIFVFQHSGLFPWKTVWENAALGVRHADGDHQNVIQEAIDLVELTGFEHHYPHQLSGGMQRRAELARALVVEPDILFMDEPFAGLDFLTRLKLREELINMHEFNRHTMLFVTHDIDEALVMGDRVVLLSERPATIRLSEAITVPHPRDFSSSPELADLRRRLYRMLDVHYAL